MERKTKTLFNQGNMVFFSLFNLEQHSNCNYDYLELHEGQLGGPMIGRFCGNVIPTNLTSYNGLWMKFRSDSSSTGQGFIAQYSTSKLPYLGPVV